jgi:hypothetical protein
MIELNKLLYNIFLKSPNNLFNELLHRPKRKMRQKYNKDNILNLI